MKHNSFFPVVLLAAIFVGSCVVGVNGQDSETYSKQFEIWLKDGEAVSPEDAVVADLDGGSKPTDASTGKQFWKLDEWDFVTFSFKLPKGVKAVEAEIQCVTNADVKGKASVSWNRQFLKDEAGKNRVVEFNGGRNFAEKLLLEKPQDANIVRIIATEGTVGIQGVTFRCEIPYPSWDFDGLVIMQTEPRPDKPLDGTPVTVKWKTTAGMPEGGWLKLEYYTKSSGWDKPQVVPGFEGITYGKPGWDSPNGDGEFLWKEPPVTDVWKLEFTYTTGKNPEDEKKAEDERIQRIALKTLAELSKIKWDFLTKAKGNIPRVWRSQAPDKYNEADRLEARLEIIFDKPEKLQENIGNTVTLLDQLDVLYCEAMLGILNNAATLDDKKERDDLLEKAEDFVALREATYNRASVRYADDDETAQYLKVFFHKERIESIREFLRLINAETERIKKEADFIERLKYPEQKLLYNRDVDVHDVCVTSSGKILVAYSNWNSAGMENGDRDRIVYIRDVLADRELGSLRMDGSLYKYKSAPGGIFSPNGTYFYTYYFNETRNQFVQVVWESDTCRHKKEFYINGRLFFSPNDRFVVFSSDDNKTLILYDFSSDRERTLSYKRESTLFRYERTGMLFGDAAFSPDEERVATKCDDGLVRVWNTISGNEIAKKFTEVMGDMTFSCDGKNLAMIDNSFEKAIVELWDIENQKTTMLDCDNGERGISHVQDVAFSPDNQVIALYCYEGYDGGDEDYDDEKENWSVFIFNVSSGKRIKQFGIRAPGISFLRVGSSWVNNLVFFPAGHFLVYAYHGCRIFDYTTGEQIQVYGPNDSMDRHALLHISPEGNSIITLRIRLSDSSDRAKTTLHQWSFGDNPFSSQSSSPLPVSDEMILQSPQLITPDMKPLNNVINSSFGQKSDMKLLNNAINSSFRQKSDMKPLNNAINSSLGQESGIRQLNAISSGDDAH